MSAPEIEHLAEQLRSQHLAAHDVPNALPWRMLKGPERTQWLILAQHHTENPK